MTEYIYVKITNYNWYGKVTESGILLWTGWKRCDNALLCSFDEHRDDWLSRKTEIINKLKSNHNALIVSSYQPITPELYPEFFI